MLHNSELEAEAKSIELIRKFNSEKKHMLNELDSLEDKSMQYEDYFKELIDKITQLEDALMEIEMLLQEALNEATGKFTDQVKLLNQDMKTKTMDYIKEVTSEVENFSVNLKNSALTEQEAFEKFIETQNVDQQSNDSDFNAKLEVLGVREELVQWLEQSKEKFDNQLAEKERYITKNITQEWEDIDKNMTNSQYARNRGIVKEIIETCQQFRSSLKEKQNDMKNEFDEG